MPDGPGGWGLPSYYHRTGTGFAGILQELHVPWPACNEDAAHAAADAWRLLADTVDSVDGQCSSVVAGLTENNDGRAIEAFAAYWQKFGGRSGVLPLTGDACRAIATACDTLADKVSEVKAQIRQKGEELVAAMTAAAVALVFTWGLSVAVSETVAATTIASVTELVETLADTIAYASRTLAEDVGLVAAPIGAGTGAAIAGATTGAMTGTFAGLFDQIFQGTISALNGEPLPSASDTAKDVGRDAKSGIILGVLAEVIPAVAEELTTDEMTAHVFSISPQLALMLSDGSKLAAWLDSPAGKSFIATGGIEALRKQGMLDESSAEGKLVEALLDGALSKINPSSGE